MWERIARKPLADVFDNLLLRTAHLQICVAAHPSLRQSFLRHSLFAIRRGNHPRSSLGVQVQRSQLGR